MSKHTKGPWSTEDATAEGKPYAINVLGEPNESQPSGPMIARLVWVDEPDICHVHGIEEARANARLMAAAPDLLEALQDTIALLGPYIEEAKAARAAIAKATGE